jgi:hypothetical protein
MGLSKYIKQELQKSVKCERNCYNDTVAKKTKCVSKKRILG